MAEGGSVAPPDLAIPAPRTRRPFFAPAFAALIALLVGNVALSTWAVHRITTSHEAATDAQETLATLWHLGTRVVDAESAERGYILTGGEEYLRPWGAALPDIQRLLADLEDHARGDPNLTAETERLKTSIEARLAILAEGVAERQQKGYDAGRSMVLTGRGLDAMAMFRADFGALERDLTARFEDASLRAHQSTAVVRTNFVVANVLALSVLGLLFSYVRRHERTRERTETTLRESEARIRLVLDTAPVLLVVVDHDGIIRMERGRALATIGFEPMQNVGRSVEEVWRDQPDILEHARRALAGESLSALERIGDTLFETHLRPLRRKNGEQDGYMVLAVDVTERVDAERRLREATEELERRVAARTAELEAANKELESFSYSVSHDLRAPLRSIDGFGAAIEEEAGETLSPTCRAYLQRLRAATRRMAQLIDDLLKLSRVTRAGLKREPIDLSQMARSILEDLAHADPSRKVDVEVEDGLTATGDTHLVRILLDNLLNNAWKFTGHTPEARIRFFRDGDAFCVADNGAGFDMAYVNRLFGPFQRLHGVDEFEGTGIGLATVQRIVARHGGRVWAEGEPGKGAKFRFTLP